jgi:hypothetical protein
VLGPQDLARPQDQGEGTAAGPAEAPPVGRPLPVLLLVPFFVVAADKAPEDLVLERHPDDEAPYLGLL